MRADGSPVGQPEFLPLERACEAGIWERLTEASRKLAADMGPLGLLARVHGAKWAAANAYVNAWIGTFQDSAPEIALHGTAEVQSVSGRTLGLIVTPLHPLRFAWHTAYDQLAAHARYEQGLLPTATQKSMSALDSSHFPAALPGVQPGSGFVFADTLGLHAVAMTLDGEREPKAAVALMTACLGGGCKDVAPSIGAESADVLAREIRYYLDCHRRPTGSDRDGPDLLNIQAWRPGDGMTVARALGTVLRDETASAFGEDGEERQSNLCFTLDFTSKPKPTLGLLARLRELADYGFFENTSDGASLLDEVRPTVVRIHGTTNGMLQNAFSSFVLYSLYKDMFRRGVQPRLTHAIIFDEAHRAARLKLIRQFGKECRKYGLALGLASQEAKDFDPSLFAAVGSYLALRVSEADARTLARMTGSTLEERRMADRLKTLEKYTAIFFGEGRPRPTSVHLAN